MTDPPDAFALITRMLQRLELFGAWHSIDLSRPFDGWDRDRTVAHLLHAHLVSAVEAAEQRLGEIDAEWIPIAAAITTWVPMAQEAQDAAADVPALKAAEDWLKQAEGELRTARFNRPRLVPRSSGRSWRPGATCSCPTWC